LTGEFSSFPNCEPGGMSVTARGLWQERDNRLLVLLVSAPLLYMLYHYGGGPDGMRLILRPVRTDLARVGFSRVMALFALGIVPALIIRFGFRERLADYGLALRAPKFNGLFVLFGGCAVVILSLITSRVTAFRAIYPEVRSAIGAPRLLFVSSLFYVLYYVGYETFFRGYLLFGLEPRLGPAPAILVTTLASTLVHISRPAGEYLGALVAGLVAGYVVLRTRSIWGVLLVHLIAGLSLDVFCALH
jgi:membrane protease YdiL (CAAX protease family)